MSLSGVAQTHLLLPPLVLQHGVITMYSDIFAALGIVICDQVSQLNTSRLGSFPKMCLLLCVFQILNFSFNESTQSPLCQLTKINLSRWEIVYCSVNLDKVRYHIYEILSVRNKGVLARSDLVW